VSFSTWLQNWLSARKGDPRVNSSVENATRLSIRRLEDRLVLSVSAVLMGTDVTFTGDDGGVSADSIVLSIDRLGNLEHNLGGSHGFHSNIDLDNTQAGDQSLAVHDITQLDIDLGVGLDSVSFADQFDFAWGGLSVAAESITTTPGSSLTVHGLTALDAGASHNIQLLGTNDFHTIQVVSANHVFLNDTNSLSFSGHSTVFEDLEITVENQVTNEVGASLSVAGGGSFSGQSVTLGLTAGDRFDFGQLQLGLSAGAEIEEDSSTELYGDVIVHELHLTSSGQITDASSGLIVSGLASFRGMSVVIGGTTNVTNFGSLQFDSSGSVQIQEDSSSVLSGDNSAVHLALNSAGEISDLSDSLLVTDLAEFHGTRISLGGIGHDTEIGQLSFDAPGAVAIQLDSSTELTGDNVAGSLNLSSTGSISDVSSTLRVTGSTDFSAQGDVIVDGANNDFSGTVTARGQTVQLTDRNSLTLGSVDVVTLSVTTHGPITIGTGAGERIVATDCVALSTSSGGVLETLGTTISTDRLALQGMGTFALNQDNAVHVLAADVNGPLSFTNSQSMAVGSACGINGLVSQNDDMHLSINGDLTIGEVGDLGTSDVNLGSGNLTLDVEDAISQRAGNTISASGLQILAAGGPVRLNEENRVTTLAADTTGTLSFHNARSLTIGTVTDTALVPHTSTQGITTYDRDVRLQVDGALLFDAPVNLGDATLTLVVAGTTQQHSGDTISAIGLSISGADATSGVDLGEANDVDTFAADFDGSVFFHDVDDLTIGSLTDTASPGSGPVQGVTTTADVRLDVGGDLALADSVDVAGNTLFLDVVGAVSQSATGTIRAEGLALQVGGTTTLNQANDVDTLALDSQGSTEYHDIDDLGIDVVHEVASPANRSITGVTLDDSDLKISTATGDLVLLQAIQSGTGNVALEATTGSIRDGQDGLTQISAHDLSLTAGSQIGDIVDFATGTGDAIDIVLTGQLTRAQVSAANGEIFLNSTGNLTAATGSIQLGGANAATAILRATGGDLDVGTAVGVFSLSSGDNLALESLRVGTTGGTLILPDSGLDVGTGDLRLRGDRDVRDAAGRDLGPLVADDLSLMSGSAGGDTRLQTRINSLTAQITGLGARLVLNEADSIVLNDVETQNGDLTILASQAAAGNIRVVNVSSGDARITLETTAHGGGQIVDGDSVDDAGVADLTAREIDLRSATGIANDTKLEIAADRFAATTLQGDINIRDVSGDLAIAELVRGSTGVHVTAGQHGDSICVTTVGTLNVDADVSQTGTGDRQILLAADGASANLNVNAIVTTTGGDSTITLMAGQTVSFAATSTTVASGTGEVQVRAGRLYQNGSSETAGAATGDILMADGSVIQSDNGTVSLLAPADVQLSVVNANAGGVEGDIVVTADADGNGTGLIRETLTGESANLIGDHVTLSAAQGIGSDGVGDIDTRAVSIVVTNTDSGPIVLNEADDLRIVQLSQSGGGNVLVQTTSGSIAVDNGTLFSNAITVAGGGSLMLDANGASSDVMVNSGILSHGGDIAIVADRDVLTHSAPISSTGGNGDLAIIAGRDIRILDPGDRQPVDLAVTGTGVISLQAANQLILGSQDPEDPDSLEHTTLNDVVIQSGTGSVTNTVPVLFDVRSPQITAQGEAVLSVTIGRPGETNLAYRVFWGDGTVETFTGLTAGTYTVHHFYSANPDPVNPAAPILVNVQAIHDPSIEMAAPNLNRGVIPGRDLAVDLPPPVPAQNINADLASAIYNPSDPLFAVLQSQIVSSPGSEASPGSVVFQDTTVRATAIPVPGEGLATIVFDTTPPVVMLSFPEGVKIVDTQPPMSIQVTSGTSAQIDSASADEAVFDERQVILEVISPTGEVIQQAFLPESSLDDLQAVISRLPDGQYRFQLREAGEGRLRLLLEFEVRQGKIADETDVSDRPPSVKQPAAETPPMEQEPPPSNTDGAMRQPLPNPALEPEGLAGDMLRTGRALTSASRAWKRAGESLSASSQGGDSEVPADDSSANTPARALALGVMVAVVGAGWWTPESSLPSANSLARLSFRARLWRRIQRQRSSISVPDSDRLDDRVQSTPPASARGGR
jgi:hypothetical protein